MGTTKDLKCGVIKNEALEIFPWNDNFVIGIPEIDAQHKKLVHMLNNLANNLVFNTDDIDRNKLFDDLADYATFHFHAEENVWHQFLAGDRWETAHKGAHESFVTDLAKLKSADETKSLNEVLEEILIFLTHWLAYHILESDKRAAMVVLAIQSGMSIEQAKQKTHQEMLGATGVLIDTVLSMYDTVAARTLQLMKIEQTANALIKRNQLMMQSTPEGIHVLDLQGKVIEFNEAFCNHLGYTHEETLQLRVQDFEALLPPEQIQVGLQKALKGHSQFETKHKRKDGTLVDVEVVVSGVELDGVKCLFALSRDITSRKEMEDKIRQLAYFDTLTNLPNRRMLNDRLSKALALSKRTGHFGVLMFIDLDNFKALNDNYGHDVGDLLLLEVARRLTGRMREMDTVARFGGDEFVVILSEIEGCKSEATIYATAVAEQILATLGEPYDLATHDGGETKNITHKCSASIGVVMFSNQENNLEELLKNADIAMYQAKDAGRNQIRFYIQ